jgi:shikimate kinase
MVINMKIRNIALIGMPGSGKTTIGALLAKDLRKPFIDTDLLIQKSRGMLLQDIICESGIDDFMTTEEKIVLDLNTEDSVIATGGSVIYSDAAMNHLRATSLIIYLQITCEEIKRRLHNPKKRGIVRKRGQTLMDLYKERTPKYKKYADITVDCSTKEIEDIVRIVEEKALLCRSERGMEDQTIMRDEISTAGSH